MKIYTFLAAVLILNSIGCSKSSESTQQSQNKQSTLCSDEVVATYTNAIFTYEDRTPYIRKLHKMIGTQTCQGSVYGQIEDISVANLQRLVKDNTDFSNDSEEQGNVSAKKTATNSYNLKTIFCNAYDDQKLSGEGQADVNRASVTSMPDAMFSDPDFNYGIQQEYTKTDRDTQEIIGDIGSFSAILTEFGFLYNPNYEKIDFRYVTVHPPKQYFEDIELFSVKCDINTGKCPVLKNGLTVTELSTNDLDSDQGMNFNDQDYKIQAIRKNKIIEFHFVDKTKNEKFNGSITPKSDRVNTLIQTIHNNKFIGIACSAI